MIHETAVVAAEAELGHGVTIGPFTCIEPDVRIGAGCVIGPHVTILSRTTVGANGRIHAGAVLGDRPQDVHFEECDSRVEIGSDCVIREGVTIHRGSKPGSVTVIGDGCFLMGFSHFAHDVRLGSGVIVANGALLAGFVQVGDRAFISGNAIVHQFVRIGRLAMLAGGCAVSKDVPPFCLLRPAALNDVRGTNVVGMRRAGLTAAERSDVNRAFKILYRSGLNTSQAAEEIGKAFSSGPALEVRDFVSASERGICGFGED